MGPSVFFYAGPTDNHALAEFAQSIGLRIFSGLAETPELQPSDDFRREPICYLSPLPKEELHPYPSPPVTGPLVIGPATDPLIDFWRSYLYTAEILVRGHLSCLNDVPHLLKITKPYFVRLTRWIVTNWKRLPESVEYIGPEAQYFIDKGVKMVSLPPGVKFEQRSVY